MGSKPWTLVYMLSQEGRGGWNERMSLHHVCCVGWRRCSTFLVLFPHWLNGDGHSPSTDVVEAYVRTSHDTNVQSYSLTSTLIYLSVN